MTRHSENERGKGSVHECNGGYAISSGTKDEPLTNWVFKPILELRHLDGTKSERGQLIINGREEHIITLPVKVWNSRKDLADNVGGYGAIIFTSSNTSIAKVRHHITTIFPVLPCARGVQTYGLHECEGEWIGLYADRLHNSEAAEEPFFYTGTPMDSGTHMFDGPLMAVAEVIDKVRNAFGLLLQLTDRNFAGAMLGYAAAAPFAPRLTNRLGNRLPFLYGAGEKESGKSSFGEICLELATGRRSRIAKAINLTPYQYDATFANANNLLAILDEYWAGGVDDTQIRKHHDLSQKLRGTGKAGANDVYHLNAPMIVLGESFTDDPATLSRGVLYFVRKQDRGTPELFKDALDVPWWAYAYHLHQQASQLSEAAHTDRFNRAEKYVDTVASSVSPRLRYALVFLAYGLLTLRGNVGDGVFCGELIESVLRCGMETTLNGCHESTTNIELFLEQLGAVAANYSQPESLISPAIDLNQIIIHISPSVIAVSKSLGGNAAISNKRLLKQYAHDSGFFSKGDTHRTLKRNSTRGLLLDLTKYIPCIL